jgi:putative spermidine/putrescine transport system ATP-binding protein
LPLIAPVESDGPAVALVRPEAVSLSAAVDASPGPLVGTVIALAFLGAVSRVTVDLGDAVVLVQVATTDAGAYAAGTRVQVILRLNPVLITRDDVVVTP